MKSCVSDLPTFEEVSAALAYDPSTGVLTWRHRADRAVWWNARRAGRAAGGLRCSGYIEVQLDGRAIMAHRLAVLLQTGQWPASGVDHVNGVKSDNRTANLRCATKSENGRNRGAQRNNTSGFKGVTWRHDDGKWQAQIKHGNRNRYLGRFDSAEAAHAAYANAAAALHGEFARVA